jgi:catechol 2,3-dioxygenase-like lactoylglutathione lyase family enzyme
MDAPARRGNGASSSVVEDCLSPPARPCPGSSLWEMLSMFSHVMVGANDLDRTKLFYDAVFGALGVGPGVVDRHRVFWRTPEGVFGVSLPIDGKPASIGNGSTVGFRCASPEAVSAWHAAGVANGGTSIEDPPGPREGAAGKVYLAYLRDPDGNKLCALHRPAS